MQSRPAPIRIFLLSDHRIVLWGLEQLIKTQGSAFEISGSATSADEALKDPGLATTDVILLDLEIEGDPVQDIIPRLLATSQAKILVLTRLNDQDLQDKAVLAGASGVAKHHQAPNLLLTALEKVHEGQMWLDREATGRVFVEFSRRVTQKPANPRQQSLGTLTDREKKIVACIAENSGETGKAIANKLHISESTLRNHLTSIYNKLGVTNRHGLTAYAFKNGLSKPSA